MQRPIVISVTAVLALVLALGTVDTLVWLPQLTAPTTPLDRIYAALGRSGDLAGSVGSPLYWLAFWSVVGALYVVALLPAHRAFSRIVLRPIELIAISALLLGAAGFLQWWSAFGMGMSVSDTLPPGVGRETPLGSAIVVGGLLLLVVGALLGIVALATRPRPSGVPA